MMLFVKCQTDGKQQQDNDQQQTIQTPVTTNDPLIVELIDKIEKLNDAQRDEFFLMLDQAEEARFFNAGGDQQVVETPN
jgi:hypothetical protein